MYINTLSPLTRLAFIFPLFPWPFSFLPFFRQSARNIELTILPAPFNCYLHGINSTKCTLIYIYIKWRIEKKRFENRNLLLRKFYIKLGSVSQALNDSFRREKFPDKLIYRGSWCTRRVADVGAQWRFPPGKRKRDEKAKRGWGGGKWTSRPKVTPV